MPPRPVEAPSLPFVRQAVVLRVEGDGTVVVTDEPDGAERLCEALHVGAPTTLCLAPKDTVLVWYPGGQATPGVVLGRVGFGHSTSDAPDELVLEAKHSLTLRVGDGSI